MISILSRFTLYTRTIIDKLESSLQCYPYATLEHSTNKCRLAKSAMTLGLTKWIKEVSLELLRVQDWKSLPDAWIKNRRCAEVCELLTASNWRRD